MRLVNRTMVVPECSRQVPALTVSYSCNRTKIEAREEVEKKERLTPIFRMLMLMLHHPTAYTLFSRRVAFNALKHRLLTTQPRVAVLHLFW